MPRKSTSRTSAAKGPRRRRPSAAAVDPAKNNAAILAAISPLHELEAELDREFRLQVRKRIETLLSTLAGPLGTPDGVAQELAASLQALLERWGFRVVCPKCQKPAKLYGRAGRTGKGVFEFVHTEGPKMIRHGGGRTLPPLKLAKFPT